MLNIREWKLFAVLALTLLCATQIAEAQLVRGFVSGTVTDTTNAILAGVQVTLTNKATNISRYSVTNDVGFYRFAAVEPGEYSIEFKLGGFESHKVESITVNTAQEVVVNQSLAPGGVTTEVSIVETPGVTLDKTMATIERTFPGRVVTELPITMNTRDVTRLALLAPTVARAPGSNEFSANGQRARNNNFTIDGVDNNDLSITQNSSRIIPEAVQEVQVQTTAYQAEFGRNSGAQFSAITKAGSNQFHGEGWDYYRGNWMEPVSLLNKRAGINDTPRFVQNQFGGDVGGPILKERTFFFGLLEFNRRREAPDARNGATTAPVVPTPTGYAALQNVPLGPGQTAASRQAVLQALTFLPNTYGQVKNYDSPTTTTVNGVAIQTATIRLPIANPFNFAYNVARVDHKISDKDNITYRYHLDKRNQPDVISNLQFGTLWSGGQTIFRQNHAISETHVFGPRLLNEARVAYVRSNLNFPENDPKSAAVIITGAFNIGGSSNYPQGRLEQLYQFQDVATYTTGRNSFKFGADLRRNKLFNRSGFDSKGTWTFGGLQAFLNSTPASLLQAVNEATFDARQWNTSYFFQDDLKATKDLTFNLGLRYEYSTVPFGFFGATDPAIRAAGVPGPAKPDKNNWAPRFGFAYSPSSPSGFLGSLMGNGKTSIRGGFGMAYDVLFYNILVVNASNYPRVLSSDIRDASINNLFPTLAPKVATLPPFDPRNTGFVNAPEDMQNPTTNFWSLSVQRELGTGYVVEAGYSGNRSYHQIRQGQTNPPVLTAAQAATVIATGNPNSIPSAADRRVNPAWGSRTTIEGTAKAEYHAAYLKFDKQMSHGLLLGANYTFSANFSDNDESLNSPDIVNSSPQVPQNFFNFRNEWSRSVFDRPNRFVIHYLYEVPWFANSPSALRQVFGGWEIAGFTEFQSGQPFTIRTGVDSAGIGTTAPARPNYNPAGTITKDPDTGDFRTFSTPINGTGIVTVPLSPTGAILANSMPGGGNLGRNTFRGPSYQQWNFSLSKKISINERWKVQVRSDFQNLWNHNNFQNPVATMVNPSFGQNTATLLSDARQMLLSAKIQF